VSTVTDKAVYCSNILMAKFFTEEAKFDPSERAEGVLDHLLDETSEVTIEQRANEISIKDALHKKRLVREESKRVRSRVLFITKDTQALEEGADAQEYFKNLAEVFDEVHVIVLGFTKRKTDTLRLDSKVWVYPTTAKSFLRQPFTAITTARQQLQFTDGFRADIVVALDPFESGIAGYFIAKKFKRAFQLQITENFYTPAFKDANKHNPWRLRFSRYVLKRVSSVFVSTELLKQNITTQYKKIKEVSLLPRYFNIQETIASSGSLPDRKLYPQFAFTILYIGTLNQNSTLFRAIDAVRTLLRTPSIGFVVIGEGPERKEFQERARILGIDSQIIFTPRVDNLVDHMHSANVLLNTDTTSGSEEIVIKAASVGLPVVMSRTALREDLFTDGVDSFLCDPEDTQEFSQKLLKFLNNGAMRTQFSKNAQDVVRTRIEEDPHTHVLAIRDAIESVLYLEDTTTKKIKVKNKKKKNTSKNKNWILAETDDAKSVNGIEIKMPEV